MTLGVRFNTFPVEVLLEGFGETILRGLGGFMAEVRAEGDEGGYRVVAEGVVPGHLGADGVLESRRPPRRHLIRDREDWVTMPGCRLRLAPGRPVAVLEFRGGGKKIDGLVITTQLEMALSHALALSGHVVNHAAAFEVDGLKILAVGPSRAGKSTLCAAVLAAGGQVVSDDSVILGLDGAVPRVGALRRNLWLREGSAQILPKELRSGLVQMFVFGEDRWRLGRETFPQHFRTRILADAVVLLSRDRRTRDFEMREISAAEGLARILMASTALFFSPRYSAERDRCLRGLTTLANSAPCFSLRMGTCLVSDPRSTIDRLVNRLRP